MKPLTRRTMFGQLLGLGIGATVGLPVAAFPADRQSESQAKQKKLKVMVVGAHPDDPESGCGLTTFLISLWRSPHRNGPVLYRGCSRRAAQKSFWISADDSVPKRSFIYIQFPRWWNSDMLKRKRLAIVSIRNRCANSARLIIQFRWPLSIVIAISYRPALGF
jgi:hypothetical protein